MPPANPNPRKPARAPSGSVQALVKAEKLTQLAFILPVCALVGWALGGLLDRWLHQHWIYILGLVLGVIAGFIQLFRMVTSPGLLASTAYDPSQAAGPGFKPDDPPQKPPSQDRTP